MRNIARLLVLMVAVLVVIPSPVVLAQQTGATIEKEGEDYVIVGWGNLKTRPFMLETGAYTATWNSLPSPRGRGGNVMIDVCRVDREYVDGTIANEIMQDGARELRGETHVYGVESGAHYLDVYAPGAWIVRLAPLT